MICRSTSGFHHLRHVIDREDLALGADQGSYSQCWLSWTRSNIQNYVPTANQPIFDKGLRDWCKDRAGDLGGVLPERRGMTPYAYNLLVGLHQQKYTYQAVDGEFGNNAKVRVCRPITHNPPSLPDQGSRSDSSWSRQITDCP